MPKICLVVDNPLRDLDGLVLLGRVLARRGADVYLVPMYTQGYEIPRICPHFVLMNYARENNVDLIKAYHNAGIGVGILDTEGGIWESEEQYVKSIAHSESTPCIDLYCLWGKRQRDALLRYTKFTESQLVVTGNSRYDFYSSPWLEVIEAASELDKDYILITTSFALSHPRFAKDSNVEINNMMKAGYEKSYVLKRLRDDLKARKELIDVVRRLAKDFSSLQIVIRPHPFEEEKEYLEVFRDMPNISIRREGTIAPWLKSALCVLHLNSSIALDAYMLGRIPISIDWINTDIIRGMSEVSYEISRKSKSYDELKDMVSHSVTRNEQNKVTHVVDTKIEQQITDWFHQIDGKASLRVAEAILKTVSKERHKSDKSRCKKMALYGSKNATSFKGWGYGLTRLALGPVLSELLRSLFFDRPAGAGVRHNKAIRVRKVNELLERIDHIVADDQVYRANCHKGRGNLADKVGMISLRIQPQEISW